MSRDARLVWGLPGVGGQRAPGAALSPEEGRLFRCFYRLLQVVLLWTDKTFVGSFPLRGARQAWVFHDNSPPDTAPARVHAHTRSPQEFLKEKKNTGGKLLLFHI